MRNDTTITTGHYYLQLRLLPESCRPAYVIRHHGVTLVAVDPRSTRRQVAEWAPDHLTEAEMNISRDAYGEPPVGEYLSDIWMGDDLFPTEVPTAIQLQARTQPAR